MKNQPAYVSEFYGHICRLMVYSRETNQSLYLYKTIPMILVHRFRNNCIIHLSTNPIAQFKKPQRSPLRLRFFNCTLESVSCVNDTVIYETMY